ncbi:MAG: trypsin-like serine protease [Proteobacteria bacterium]|nr:trypsin-like serine protease [Cystobacterineae bacterium]MCL2258891.1 trypsin-like serine protease [Cystobacterineae bacterium]MCL2314646.1 trypsin-like serine protease [Pseudomonadota bacterium]
MKQRKKIGFHRGMGPAFCLFLTLAISFSAYAQIPPPNSILGGTPVNVEQHKSLGLVTIHNARNCSGTLLNRYWVLTARHCVTTEAGDGESLRMLHEVAITATWAPNIMVSPARIQELAINVPTPRADIVLLYLGNGDFGPVPTQRIYTGNNGRIRASDTIKQYGQGYSIPASGVYGTPSAQKASGRGVYRAAEYKPPWAPAGMREPITEGEFCVAPNASGQMAIGGDSGGPVRAMLSSVDLGIVGVASAAQLSGTIPGTPSDVYAWEWATGVSWACFASTERFINEIAELIKEIPPPPPHPSSVWLPAILELILD